MTALYIIAFLADLFLLLAVLLANVTGNTKPMSFLIYTYVTVMSFALVAYSVQKAITVPLSILYMAIVLLLAGIYAIYTDNEEEYEEEYEKVVKRR